MKLGLFRFALLAFLAPLSVFAANSYDYAVGILPPFGRVLINNTITCPSSNSRDFWCDVPAQPVNSVMTIIGVGLHACYLTVQADGSLKIDQSKSVFCTPVLTPASLNSKGSIELPVHF